MTHTNHTRWLAPLFALAALAGNAEQTTMPPTFPDFSSGCAEARNMLVKTMTGVDPLTQGTVTAPPTAP